MRIKEIAFTGYQVTDVPRARQFYEEVLGLNPAMVHELDGHPGKYWIEYEIDDGAIAISNMWEPDSNSGPSIAFEVDDFDTAMAELKEAGVNIVADRIESPSCKFSLITDPDGNGITIHKHNE